MPQKNSAFENMTEYYEEGIVRGGGGLECCELLRTSVNNPQSMHPHSLHTFICVPDYYFNLIKIPGIIQSGRIPEYFNLVKIPGKLQSGQNSRDTSI